jgi:hypothetical protein
MQRSGNFDSGRYGIFMQTEAKVTAAVIGVPNAVEGRQFSYGRAGTEIKYRGPEDLFEINAVLRDREIGMLRTDQIAFF